MDQNEVKLQFHFRNFYQNEMHVRVHHAGCAITPWYDGRPGCWKNRNLPYCPGGLGSGEAVYVPSEWVVRFGEWWQLIKAGLTLIIDLGIMIATPPPLNKWDLVGLCSDIWALDSAIVDACIDDLSPEELQDLLDKAQQSLEHSCKAIDISVEEVTRLAKQMGLSDKWAFIAGPTYTKYIHDNDSPLVYNHGWSVFREKDTPWEDDDRRIARAAFIEKGHLIYVVDDANKTKMWSNKW